MVEEIERDPEILCRLSTIPEPSTSTDAITEADSEAENQPEKASLLANFSRNSSSTQLQSVEDTREEVASVSLRKELAADTSKSLLDHNTQVSLSIWLLSFLPGYCLMFIPICDLIFAILKHKAAGDELQRHTKDILIFHSVLLVVFFGICVIVINRTRSRSLEGPGHTEMENFEEEKKKKGNTPLELGWKLAVVAFYPLLAMSSVWMQYLVIATIARDPTGISHLLQFKNLSLAYALLPKLLVFAF
ncbi:hypothetical protein Landi51_13280 [Colletotrichum acutatum]